MTMAFFFFFFSEEEEEAGVFWWTREDTDEKTEKKKKKKAPFEGAHQKEHHLDEMPVPPKTLKSSPHTASSLRFLNHRQDVICHVSKVREHARRRSPFRNAAVLSLWRDASSQAHYLSVCDGITNRTHPPGPSVWVIKEHNAAKWCLRAAAV